MARVAATASTSRPLRLRRTGRAARAEEARSPPKVTACTGGSSCRAGPVRQPAAPPPRRPARRPVPAGRASGAWQVDLGGRRRAGSISHGRPAVDVVPVHRSPWTERGLGRAGQVGSAREPVDAARGSIAAADGPLGQRTDAALEPERRPVRRRRVALQLAADEPVGPANQGHRRCAGQRPRSSSVASGPGSTTRGPGRRVTASAGHRRVRHLGQPPQPGGLDLQQPTGSPSPTWRTRRRRRRARPAALMHPRRPGRSATRRPWRGVSDPHRSGVDGPDVLGQAAARSSGSWTC